MPEETTSRGSPSKREAGRRGKKDTEAEGVAAAAAVEAPAAEAEAEAGAAPPVQEPDPAELEQLRARLISRYHGRR